MRRRRRYSDLERKRILSAVERDELTGREAAKKFGVSEVTLWKWRKAAKDGATGRNGQRVQANGSLVALVRDEVHARVREFMPGIVREEVGSYVQRAFGSKRARVRVRE